MDDRSHQRIPYAVQVEFRTASSFLVAYSVNLSRGGLFLETTNDAPVGSEITLQFTVPGAGPMLITGRVSWRREKGNEGPGGIGIEFDDIRDSVGEIIDRLVADFEGLNIMLLSGDKQDRSTLSRLIRSIIGTAEVLGAGDTHMAETLIDDDIDLVVVDADFDPDGALRILKLAAARQSRIPTIALTSNKKMRERARAAGASEVASNPPPFSEFQRLLVRALGRPLAVVS
jgi:uncharacterized protein (TIGR02266 family)